MTTVCLEKIHQNKYQAILLTHRTAAGGHGTVLGELVAVTAVLGASTQVHVGIAARLA